MTDAVPRRPAPDPPADELLTGQAAAAWADLSRQRLHQLAHQGRLGRRQLAHQGRLGRRQGRRWVFTRAELTAYTQKRIGPPLRPMSIRPDESP